MRCNLGSSEVGFYISVYGPRIYVNRLLGPDSQGFFQFVGSGTANDIACQSKWRRVETLRIRV